MGKDGRADGRKDRDLIWDPQGEVRASESYCKLTYTTLYTYRQFPGYVIHYLLDGAESFLTRSNKSQLVKKFPAFYGT
jgi:hypothetical protein